MNIEAEIQRYKQEEAQVTQNIQSAQQTMSQIQNGLNQAHTQLFKLQSQREALEAVLEAHRGGDLVLPWVPSDEDGDQEAESTSSTLEGGNNDE